MTQVVKLENRYNTPTSLPVISKANDFVDQLKTHNINDFPHKDLKIVNNGNNYIININGQDKFQVQNKHYLVNFLNTYLSNLKNDDNLKNLKIVQYELFAAEKELLVKTIQDNEQNLAEDISEEQANDILKNQYERYIEAKSRQHNILKIDTLTDFYKDIINQRAKRSGKKAKGEQKTHWKLVTQSAQQQLDMLEKLRTTNQLAIQNQAINKDKLQAVKIEETFIEVSEKLDELILKAQATNTEILKLETGDANIFSLYSMDLQNLSPKEAKNLEKTLKKYKKNQSSLANAMIGVNQEKMLSQDIDGLIQYLNAVSRGEPATYNPQFQEQLNNLNATIQANENLTNGGISGSNSIRNQQNSGKNTNTNRENQATSGVFTQEEINNMSPQERRTYNSLLEANSKGGAFGALDHLTKDYQDLSPRGQQFYKSFGNVALLAGGIFLGAKFIKSAWRIITGKAAKDENDNSWAWILGTGGLLLATAGRPQDLFKGGYASEMVSRFFSWAGGKGKNNKNTTTGSNTPTITPPTLDIAGGSSQNTSQLGSSSEMVSSMVGAVTLFNGQTYGSMKEMLEQTGEGNNKKIKIKKDQYNGMMEQLDAILKNQNTTNEQKNKAQLQKAFLTQIGPEDKTGLVNTILTGIGLDRETLSNSNNKDKKFDNEFEKRFERVLNLTSYMQNNKIEKMNDKETKAVQKYINEGESDLNTIFKERFEPIKNREEEINQANITTWFSKDALANMNEQEFRHIIGEGNTRRESQKGAQVNEQTKIPANLEIPSNWTEKTPNKQQLKGFGIPENTTTGEISGKEGYCFTNSQGETIFVPDLSNTKHKPVEQIYKKKNNSNDYQWFYKDSYTQEHPKITEYLSFLLPKINLPNTNNNTRNISFDPAKGLYKLTSYGETITIQNSSLYKGRIIDNDIQANLKLLDLSLYLKHLKKTKQLPEQAKNTRGLNSQTFNISLEQRQPSLSIIDQTNTKQVIIRPNIITNHYPELKDKNTADKFIQYLNKNILQS